MNKTVKSENQVIVETDVLRYKKNKLASTLALLGLVFNCLYFLLMYAMPNDGYKNFEIGVSVVLTLVTLLFIFLSSEGVKGYNKKFSIVLLVIAAFQIIRIFGFPLEGLKNNWLVSPDTNHQIGYFGIWPKSSSVFFTILLIYLCASAGCLIASAVVGWIYATRLENFQKKLDEGLDIMETIAALDKEEAAVAEALPEEAEKSDETEVAETAEKAEPAQEQAESAEEVK